MKAYPKYKPSNIEWIGEIPEHWEVKKLKFIDRVIMGQSPSSEDYNDFHGGLPFLQGNAEFGKINPNPKIWCETANKISSAGDILVSVRAPIGAVNMADQEYGIGRGLCAIRPIKSNNKYLYYFFISLNDELNSIGTGSTYTAISVDEVENIKIPYAELPEQCSISIYLENRTQKIDALIDKKQKLINLLKEERTAIINQAAIKGLNPDAPMKDSGIEWLGEIPKHWEVKKLKNVVKGKLKYGANESAELEDVFFPRYIRITDFGDDGKLRDDTFKSLPFEIANEYLLEKGDILFARSGATVGKTFQFKNYQGLACFAGYLIKASPDENKILSDFLYLFTKSNVYENWKNSIYIQATIQNIGADKYNLLQITAPPIEEQESIVELIECESTKIDHTISRIEKEITLLQEYRTALISEVVTGKIDVREAI